MNKDKINKLSFHTIKLDNKCLFFDARTFELLKISCEAYDTLNSIKSSSDILGGEISNEFESLINKGIISKNDCDLKCDYLFNRIVLFITNVCNLRCSYCFENGCFSKPEIMSEKTIDNSVRFLMKHSPCRKVKVELFGGEPLLSMDRIRYAVNSINDYASKYKKKVSIRIVTNGTLINDSLAKYFSENKIMLQLSVDGCKASHDEHRRYADGTGSYDTVFNNIKLLDKYGVQYAVHAVISRESVVQSQESLRHLSKISKKLFNFNFLISKSGDLNFCKSEAVKYLESYRDFMKEETANYTILDHGIFTVAHYQYLIFNKQRIDKGCLAGYNNFSIMPDGLIYICQRLGKSTKYNINDDPKLGDLWQDHSRNIDDGKCAKCWAKYLCGGGCAYEAKILNNGKEPAWWTCMKTKIEIETAIKTIYNHCSAN